MRLALLLVAALFVAPLPAGAASAGPCEVELSVRRTAEPDGIHFTALARNLTSRTITLSAPDACPSGPIRFTGMPEGYDYYVTCAKGACFGPRPPVTWRIAPGRSVELASVVIHPNGGNCQAALGAKSYQVTFEPPGGATTCGPSPIDLRGGAAKGAPSPDKRRCPPRPPCGLACDGPFAKDANGCTLCACADSPPF